MPSEEMDIVVAASVGILVFAYRTPLGPRKQTADGRQRLARRYGRQDGDVARQLSGAVQPRFETGRDIQGAVVRNKAQAPRIAARSVDFDSQHSLVVGLDTIISFPVVRGVEGQSGRIPDNRFQAVATRAAETGDRVRFSLDQQLQPIDAAGLKPVQIEDQQRVIAGQVSFRTPAFIGSRDGEGG